MNKEDAPEPLMIAVEVADYLHIPVATLKKNVSFNPSSVPPGLKLGTSKNSPIRWRKSTIDKWLEECEQKAMQERNIVGFGEI